MILKSRSPPPLYNINLDCKVLKGFGIIIESSRAFFRKTKQLNLSIKQVLPNTGAQCFFCCALTSRLIGVINIVITE
jgi:hypothetical protein